MSESIDHNKIVVLTGAGVSAESGLPTFRDMNGLWNKYSITEVASPEAWESNPQLVLDFYNERRKKAVAASPNVAHKAIAELEKKYDVVVITQNVDDLHERGGSSSVIHVHGELVKARSTTDSSLIYEIGGNEIKLGDVCEKGAQLRPHIVWFGEAIHNYEISAKHIKNAGKVLVIGTSLTVYPAAGLLNEANYHAEKILVSLDVEDVPYGFHWMKGTAVDHVPLIVNCWLEGKKVT
ncbi:SIR2 family NAD-dependent protein deacylase [Gimesia fumaroli]|uniref:protein acetyllysine N-acetyltransferase n=1 Tax=Gimesia fumaroli TaxID=2527976 RepID=A0A518IF66_9PLAN|nr:NAD-dependent protein deacylase [Gimesia fumaroli]